MLNTKEEELEILKNREKEMDDQINNLWLMRTPERVENLPSPPYVITKDEFSPISNQSQSKSFQPPHSTIMALKPLYKIMTCPTISTRSSRSSGGPAARSRTCAPWVG